MNEDHVEWIIRGLVLFLMGAVLFLIGSPAWAQGAHDNCNGPSCNDAVVIETIVPGSSSRGYAVGGGDMEISDCLATHSILFGLWQGTHTNPYCEADKMDAQGKYLEAAKMRCSTKKYQKVYGKDCIDAVILSAPEVLVGQVPTDRYDELLQRLEQYEDEQQQANRSYTAQQQVQQQQYEEIKQIESARKRKQEIIRKEFGSEQNQTDH